ncbi:MAG TPA: motility protein A [Pirellulales bacterium]|nr:motility protein A [Pirellulales bacterium]
MDIASIVGFLLAVIFMASSVVMGGGSFAAFIDPASIIVTIGGSLATVMICFPLKNFVRSAVVAKAVFVNKPPSIPELVDELVKLAEISRQEGLLALEAKTQEIKDPFLVMGVQMTADGTRPEVLEYILRTEMEAVNERHKEGKAFFDQWGKMGPSFGMIGTLLGLILMLGNLSDPDALGPGMAVAMITTLYGAVLSNVLCLPFAEKLNYVNKQELQAMEIVVRGILAIQAGDSPRVVAQKLSTFIPPKQRAGRNEKAA